MFNDKYGLTDAVLRGEKTQTRRMAKDKITKEVICKENVISWRYYQKEKLVEFLMKNGDIKVSVLPYEVGEVVAVAQRYRDIFENPFTAEQCLADELPHELLRYENGYDNKMFVKPNYMPFKIKIKDIRFEWLQDISNEDCLLEGIFNDKNGSTIGYPFGIPFYYTFKGAVNKDKKQLHWTFPKEAFEALINKSSVGGKVKWEDNPFVFVYSFQLIR